MINLSHQRSVFSKFELMNFSLFLLVSGLYPLFRSGATELFGAFVHVRASAKVQLEGESHMEVSVGILSG